ncbi:MAG: TauD/TfdA family dioxygenase [Gammaproteobacteria bacterium]|nr:TauD/TfdA family dioxygenase [Gammaproteobacteria bacterium]
MAIEVNRLGKHAGAEVIGVDLSKPLSDDVRETLRAALTEHVALVFRDQTLSQDQFADAVACFGEPIPQNFVDDRLDNPCVSLVSNTIPGANGERVYHASYWHTDHTNRESPPSFTALYAVELPPSGGGDTGILNTRVAYEQLSPRLRERIENLETVNVYSGSATPYKSHKAATLKHSDPDTPWTHPLVRTHPDTGAKALYLHMGKLERFEGMTPEDSHVLVRELLAEIERPEFIYKHQWRRGDLLIWDDRTSMHQAYADYDLNETRTLYRVIAGPQRPA